MTHLLHSRSYGNVGTTSTTVVHARFQWTAQTFVSVSLRPLTVCGTHISSKGLVSDMKSPYPSREATLSGYLAHILVENGQIFPSFSMASNLPFILASVLRRTLDTEGNLNILIFQKITYLGIQINKDQRPL